MLRLRGQAWERWGAHQIRNSDPSCGIRDLDRAQDAVHDALVSAWRGARALRDPEAWDDRLRPNVVRSCYRLGRRRVAARAIEADAAVAQRDVSIVTHDEVIEEFDVEEPAGGQSGQVQIAG